VSLSALLQSNSSIYIKENGLGMVASPSFRGTTAQQTAIVWNGITVNSQLLGQADLNLFSIREFDQISIRAGGGSTLYGTGAVGGSIHLNNVLRFAGTNEYKIFSEYGSFGTVGLHSSNTIRSKNKVIQFKLSTNRSDNDYPFVRPSGRTNENGSFDNVALTFNAGWKYNAKNQLNFYHQYFKSNRELSSSLYAPSSAGYNDEITRNLIEWVYKKAKLIHKVKGAFLSETYAYLPSLPRTNSEGNTALTGLLRYESYYYHSQNITLSASAEYNKTKGSGDFLTQQSRNVGLVSLFMQHQILPQWHYEASVRQEITDWYQSPLLYSLTNTFFIQSNYSISAVVSKNYRIPSFNDLFWQPNGNPNLIPEESHQFEIFQKIEYKQFKGTITGYVNRISNMLRWLPQQNGFWTPVNTDKVHIEGVEVQGDYTYEKKPHQLVLNGSHAYTASKNIETQKQLVYVPFNKSTVQASYSYKQITTYLRWIRLGHVFTSSDNAHFIKGYSLTALGGAYRLGQTKNTTFGVRVENLFNQPYEIVENRPMPGRYYNCNLIFNF
jgi:vitamin B12 transporter